MSRSPDPNHKTQTDGSASAPTLPAVQLPDAPSLVATAQGGVWISEDGEVDLLSADSIAARLLPDIQPYVCHGRGLARRLGIRPFDGLDVLELFAFVRPAAFCLPTPRGLAQALNLVIPVNHEDEAMVLPRAAACLLDELTNRVRETGETKDPLIATIWAMSRGGWTWGQTLLTAMARIFGAGGLPEPTNLNCGLKIWALLEEWEEGAPEPPAENYPVEPVEARARLVQLLGRDAEDRTEQAAYASTVSAAFLPREMVGEPHVVVAEAGTGIGKTLGYVAAASVWAEKNRGTVWISTYTRNLQRQLDMELDRLFPIAEEKATRVVVRKGRENYLCLLNFEEAVSHIPAKGGAAAVPLGLMARWLLASRDGDMIGGDFPSWLTDLLGRGQTIDLTDTRGECTYSACTHYKRCFIEHSQRKARRADIVVANHALVMAQAALGGSENGADGGAPTRYVFDEGHHLFDAADSAFAADLTGMETTELRRWLIGAEAGSRSRSRGLKARVSDLVAGDDKAQKALDEIMHAARTLPATGWLQRIAGGTPHGSTEAFLALVRQQVYARDTDSDNAYSLETETVPAIQDLADAAGKLEQDLGRLMRPMTALIQGLFGIMDQDGDSMDSATRNRIEAVGRSIERRGLMAVRAWIAMLRALHEETPEVYVDWFSVERWGGNDQDVGLHRHWIDPMEPFAEAVMEPAHGVVVTSATLRDRDLEEETTDEDGPTPLDGEPDVTGPWASARERTGANHLAAPALMEYFPSPFDYGKATKVLVVGDVSRNAPDQVAAAYRSLFQASGGGGLGLFTAVNRLRGVHQRIAADLDRMSITLLAQHVDPLDTGTLVDIFRAEEDSCLLGTDAVRDGVDVPGRSLRLIVFDRVPWPRPDILHRARRDRFSGRAYDEMLTRLKLKQAYGRLIRTQSDRGIFVMLDKAVPSRLLDAFPTDVQVTRCGLAEAVATVRSFLGEENGGGD
jgi:ATP-dependent DNA helicase DinG